MNSGSGKRSRTLAGSSSAEEAKKFLVALANLRDDKLGLKWLRSRFPDVLEAAGRDFRVTYRQVHPEVLPGTPEHDEGTRSAWLIPLRETLRAIWRAPDVRSKEWGLFRITQDFFLRGYPDMIRRPTSNGTDFLLSWGPPTRTEKFLLELMKWAELTRYCQNPDCPAPYFIASKRRQKYCCLECSKPSQREFKRKWWAENGRRKRSR